MKSFEDRIQTIVLNLADGREMSLSLPPNEAVVAAFELYEAGNPDLPGNPDPGKQPRFRVHRLGYSCGDWIAYFDGRILEEN